MDAIKGRGSRQEVKRLEIALEGHVLIYRPCSFLPHRAGQAGKPGIALALSMWCNG